MNGDPVSRTEETNAEFLDGDMKYGDIEGSRTGDPRVLQITYPDEGQEILLNMGEALALRLWLGLVIPPSKDARTPMPAEEVDMLLKELDELKAFVRRVAEFDDYTHDDVDEKKILHDLQHEAQKIL